MSGKVAVLGAGAMGTACALVLADHPDEQVALWTHNRQHAHSLRQRRENLRFLPGVALTPQVRVADELEEALAGADLVLLAIPTVYLREALTKVRNRLTGAPPMASVAKGLENRTFLRPTEIVRELTGQHRLAALSGPSHAEEVARHLPATVVAASADLALAEEVQRRFSTERFRVYTNTDILGVELAGALKNIIALAAGVCDGLHLGDNAKAALLTRGLVEIIRFGTHFGAQRETFYGLAGIGDLVTTCNSPHSRNRSVGEALGKGRQLEEILESMEGVPEGVWTARSVHARAKQLGIEMPITDEVYAVMFEGRPAADAVRNLMLREPKAE
ncbi:MAG: NAD(P)H-dependent glycerol-3-phosphate dehydrogenase [Pirellulales bacterium]